HTVRTIAAAGQSRRIKVAGTPKVAGSRVLYAPMDPITTLDSTQKVALLEKVEKLARAKDPRIAQVMAGLAGEYDVGLVARAVGHGLEGDFNRKGSSAFSGRIGQRVAAPGVTVLDDGTLPDRRGSLNVDDEGNATQRNVLIEDGILRGYIQDAMNARLMKVAP